MPAVSVVVTSAVVTSEEAISEEAISVASILVEATSAVSGVSTSEVTGLHSIASADFTDGMDSVASTTDIHFIGITA
jgi:hypothetical protein